MAVDNTSGGGTFRPPIHGTNSDLRHRSDAHWRGIRALHAHTSDLAWRSRNKGTRQVNVASRVIEGPRIEENLDIIHLKSLPAKDMVRAHVSTLKHTGGRSHRQRALSH